MMAQEEIKKILGAAAAQQVQAGMLVGLGSGSTSLCFIQSLGMRCAQEHLKIEAVSSSVYSLEQAKMRGIPVRTMDGVTQIDLTVDGADEINAERQMIKGGGGALVREKILASTSTDYLIIVDHTKVVLTLGRFGLPVEILPFGWEATVYKLQHLGYLGSVRKKSSTQPYITDNGNYIFDIRSPSQFPDPRQEHLKICALPGVVDTGFFFDLPVRVLVGDPHGKLHTL